jgi:hypothetical protein
MGVQTVKPLKYTEIGMQPNQNLSLCFFLHLSVCAVLLAFLSEF